MKKLIYLLAALVMVFTACGETNDNAGQGQTGMNNTETNDQNAVVDNGKVTDNTDDAKTDMKDSADDLTDGATDAVRDAADGVGDAAKGVTKGATDAVRDAAEGVDKAVTGNK